jgi:nickel/cobalt exporter
MGTAETLPLEWFYLPVAFILGAFHALEPGHGKSLASAYLISGEHNWKDAVVLGVATTISHTAVVVLLAVASLVLRNRFSGPTLELGIARVGASLLILMGLWVSVRAVQAIRHGHGHAGNHSHGHAISGENRSKQGFWGVALLGLSNGALPCPGALAALLVAISIGKVTLGLATVLTYSLGLAVALASMGIVVVEAGRRMRSWIPGEKVMLWIPLGSGLLVLMTGLWMGLHG